MTATIGPAELERPPRAEPSASYLFEATLLRGSKRGELEVEFVSPPPFDANLLLRSSWGRSEPVQGVQNAAFLLRLAEDVNFGALALFLERASDQGMSRAIVEASSVQVALTLADHDGAESKPELVVAADGRIGVLVLAMEPNDTAYAATYALAPLGSAVPLRKGTVRVKVPLDLTWPEELGSELKRLCRHELQPCRRVALSAGKEQDAHRGLSLLNLLGSVQPDEHRVVAFDAWYVSGPETIQRIIDRVGFPSSFAREQRARFRDLFPPQWVQRFPEGGPRLAQTPAHWSEWSRQSLEVEVLSDEVPVDRPSRTPRFDNRCPEAFCPPPPVKAAAQRLVADMERGLASGNWSQRERTFGGCPAAVPQTRRRRLVLDEKKRVRALQVEQALGLNDALTNWYFDANGHLLMRFEAHSWPKAPNARVQASERHVYFDGGVVTGSEEAHWGPSPMPLPGSSWTRFFNTAEQAAAVYEHPGECQQMGRWLSGAPELVDFSAVDPLPGVFGRTSADVKAGLRLAQEARAAVAAGRWVEKKRVGCPAELLRTSAGWLWTTLVLDEDRRPRALGVEWFGPHSRTEHRVFYDEVGRPRFEVVRRYRDDGGHAEFLRLLDEKGETVATDAVVGNEGRAEYGPPPFDWAHAPLLTDPEREFNTRWECNR